HMDPGEDERRGEGETAAATGEACATARSPTERRERMIKDDVLVFDCVAHPLNFDSSNTIGNAGEMVSQHLFAFHHVLTPEDEPKLSSEEFLKEWSTEEIARMVFDESDTDMLVAMPLPLTDLFRDGLSPWERCVELAEENPDRT